MTQQSEAPSLEALKLLLDTYEDILGTQETWADADIENLVGVGHDLSKRVREAEGKELKLRSTIQLKQRAVDRWVPCPDHRDKINPGYETPQCYVCKLEKADAENAKLRARVSALEEAGRESIDALQAALFKLPNVPRYANCAARVEIALQMSRAALTSEAEKSDATD